MLSSATMTHVFISPHPDDAALSCGGLIASLRELGQNVTIVSVFSGGPRQRTRLSDYQRAALGFGSKAIWPNTEAFRPRQHRSPTTRSSGRRDAAVGGRPGARRHDPGSRQHPGAPVLAARLVDPSANITNVETTDRPLADSVAGQGSLVADRLRQRRRHDIRRAEDERYAWFMESRSSCSTCPTPSFAATRATTSCWAPCATTTRRRTTLLRREILRLEPQMVYFPLGVGDHVDHQLCREVGVWRCSARAAAGSCRRRTSPAGSPSTRTSRTPGGTISAAPPTCRRARLPRGRLASSRAYSGHHGHARAQGRGPAPLREPDHAALRERSGHARRPRRLPRADRLSPAHRGYAERYWAPSAPNERRSLQRYGACGAAPTLVDVRV